VGYGRSFDTGVFGSIFGHTITQNIPGSGQPANQLTHSNWRRIHTFGWTGPSMPRFRCLPMVFLPNPGTQVSSSSRPNPLHLTTIDAWNLSVQRSLTPTLSLTVAYVGNKGTHTLGDGDSNGTNPNEGAIFLPGANSSPARLCTTIRR
jgi:hypothetical protein